MSDHVAVADLLDGDAFLTAAEVAELFRVDPKTVTRWAKQGRIPAQKNPGGRAWLFRTSAVAAELNRGGADRG